MSEDQIERVSNTLYVSKISDKVSVNKIILNVFAAFSPYGTILDISAHHGLKRRGQAWVTYESIESASKAKKALNNIYLFNSPIKVQYAKHRNISILKLNGMYNPYGRKAETLEISEAKKLASGPIPYHWDFDMGSEDDEIENYIPSTATTNIETDAPVAAQTYILQKPNNTLFMQNLPEVADAALLEFLLSQYPGFKEVRVPQGVAGIAFVVFDTIEQATVCLEQFNGYNLEGNIITIQYAK